MSGSPAGSAYSPQAVLSRCHGMNGLVRSPTPRGVFPPTARGGGGLVRYMAMSSRHRGWVVSDPSGQVSMLRWWDGERWTDKVRPCSERPALALR